MRHGQTRTHRAARLLGAGAPVAARRDGRDRHRAFRGRAGHLGADADGDGVAYPGRALRPAAGAGVPAVVAAGLPPRCLDVGDIARRFHFGDDAGGWTPRPDSHRSLRGGLKPAGLGGVVVARAAGVKQERGDIAACSGA